MQTPSSIAVLGAGSYGTALAISLARNGHKVCLWGHNPEHMAKLLAARENQLFLPGIIFPPLLAISDNLQKTVSSFQDLLVVVPSHVFGDVLKQIKPYLSHESRLAWATKGLEVETGRLLQDVARDILGPDIPLAVISGPTFAKELAAGLPTAISIAATDDTFADDLQTILHHEQRFRAYLNNDMIGVQLGGAVKNVIAIGAGISDGMGFGANARTALITRGIAEISRLGVSMGADPFTFMGMAGLGDLVLTCTDNQSRNRRFGLLLGQGATKDEALEEIGQVVEGFRNTQEVHELAKRHNVSMPIVEQMYAILYQGKSAKEASLSLLGRDRREENRLGD
ncbi:NAD(P)H-dependent glycerol-3-phosphate dehydrogenase [Thorsellia anophelis]|uniref:Glycerol-3-phosphate dehydrogenase [NAD(P)+] n=1 Tax=Thorsellia anophelis DSM 18579 TaxID=1123402 RepID=A0A1I0DCJ3_9GAMM|nr:NAD(P)H-dependent glycerol-3-phosphate dehydrogenase [Thorsellia anophelis]SET30018.1 glycerol 3-phosphate dehydrogenase (NAD(P)+) [Thorsellia anophelis DSM 18579]